MSNHLPPMPPMYFTARHICAIVTVHIKQSLKPQWWGGLHGQAAKEIEPATCRSQDERPTEGVSFEKGKEVKRAYYKVDERSLLLFAKQKRWREDLR